MACDSDVCSEICVSRNILEEQSVAVVRVIICSVWFETSIEGREETKDVYCACTNRGCCLLRDILDLSLFFWTFSYRSWGAVWEVNLLPNMTSLTLHGKQGCLSRLVLAILMFLFSIYLYFHHFVYCLVHNKFHSDKKKRVVIFLEALVISEKMECLRKKNLLY